MRAIMQAKPTRLLFLILPLTVGVGQAFATDQPAKEAEAAPSQGEDLLPPHAKPGECYARVALPPVYKTVTEEVVKRAASETVSIVPAKYETVEENVVVREATKRIEVVPGIYEWVDEQVLVKPASKVLKEVPAVYETVTEQVVEKEGYTYWKKGRGPIQKVDHATGEIMCLVEVPPVYKTITKKVLKTPATTVEAEIPALYTSIRKQIEVAPPTIKEVEVPAEYKTMKVNKLVEPAREVRTPVPAEYQSITHSVKVQDSRMEWRSILCQTNMTKNNIVQIQKALRAAGYDPGKIDGRLGRRTMVALHRFQKEKNLPVDEYVNMDTVKALQVGF